MLWLNKTASIVVLFALVFLRIVDLAVFEADHDHVEKAHVQVHVSDLAHAHQTGELSEHESPDAMAAHIGFHTLLGTLMDTPVSSSLIPLTPRPNRFGRTGNRLAVTRSYQPPVPPPLA